MARRDRESFRDDFMILPDEELRAQFKYDKKIIRLLSLPMLAYFYAAVMLLPAMVDDNAAEALTGFSMAAGFICYSFIFTEKPETQKRLVRAADIFQLLLIAAGLVAGMIKGLFLGPILQVIAALAPNIANLIARPFIKELAELREHPRYPFDNWRRDESVMSGRYMTAGTAQDFAVKRVSASMNKGRVLSGGHEDVFKEDVEELKKKELSKEELVVLLQEKARIWTDESDKTGYILDNLDKMYFDDGLQNGELIGEELESQLRKATAPAKPPKPVEEDFFQTQPIVWGRKKS